MRYHTLNISREFLDMIIAGEKSIELRCGEKYLAVQPGHVIQYRNGSKNKSECEMRVTRVEQYLNYDQFENINQGLEFVLAGTGFDAWSHLRKGFEGFYGDELRTEPFVVIHLGEVERG